MARPRRSSDKFEVIDLFAGPGGLGEGFTSLEVNGKYPFDIVLSAEKDPTAQQTLELRSFYRKFRETGTPDEYWHFLRGEISREQLFSSYPLESGLAIEESECFELGPRNRRLLEERLDNLHLDRDRTIVIGGPPCQAYSIAGRSRNSAKRHWRLETDDRSHLYREYLHVLAHVEPIAFVMENVRGLLSATFDGSPLFDLIRADLENPRKATKRQAGGRKYRLIPLGSMSSSDLFGEPLPKDFVLRAEEHGIPQSRHRVIVVGIAEDAYRTTNKIRSLPRVRQHATVRSAIDRLTPLRSGVSRSEDSHNAWLGILRAALKTAWLRTCEPLVRSRVMGAVEEAASRALGRGGRWVPGEGRRGVTYNHSSRGHMPADLHRYLFASCYAEVHGTSPTLEMFPKGILPNHTNVRRGTKVIFNDRFRVQCWDSPATTIVSHISKDGHYYIHPDPSQCRSFTVREAARLQTFPDDYFFCGPRTAQYHQVGNAVPIRLARQLAREIYRSLVDM